MFLLLAVKLFAISTKSNNVVGCYTTTPIDSSMVPTTMLMPLPWYAIHSPCAPLLSCAGMLNCTSNGMRMCAIRPMPHTYVCSLVYRQRVPWYMCHAFHVPVLFGHQGNMYPGSLICDIVILLAAKHTAMDCVPTPAMVEDGDLILCQLGHELSSGANPVAMMQCVCSSNLWTS